MADLGLGQKPIIMPHYPHMLSEDIAVWTEYLKDPIALIKRVWYDVKVGGAIDTGKPVGSLEQRIAAGVSRKRIDVIALVGGGYWVIEIKPFGSMMAMGQVLTYSRLFTEEYRPAGQVFPVIVCSRADPDMIGEFDDAGVVVIEV